MLDKEKNQIEFKEKKEYSKRRIDRIDIDIDEIQFKNFFDLNDNELNALNPYSLEEALKRIDSLSYDDIKDDLKYFQVKDLELKNYEELNTFSLDNIKFVTSSKKDKENEKIEKEFYLLNDLSDFLISDDVLKDKKEGENNKKIIFEIQTQENGKKCIIIKCLVDADKISKNIINNFIDKSPSENKEIIKENYEQYLKKNYSKYNFKLIIKIQFNSLNRIYYNYKKGEYFLDLQSPPIFKTNLFITDKGEQDSIKDENCLFPFRDFEDEISNLKYRHFIIMLQKNIEIEKEKKDEINLDTNEELCHSLENLFKNRKGEIEKYKYVKKHITLKIEDKNSRNLRYFFNYKKNEEIKKKLEELFFLKEKPNAENDEEVIKLFYQTLSLISENILSYFNGKVFLEKLLINNNYRKDIFEKCTNDNFPIFFNITLTKILDKYQNSLEEKSLISIFSKVNFL